MLHCSVGNVKTFHNLLGKEFGGVLNQAIELLSPISDWDAKRYSGEVEFFATSDTARRIDEIQERAGQPAVELPGFEDTGDRVWFTWHESWLRDTEEMRLKSAGFSFFWGGYKPEQTIFRAEWTSDGDGARAKAAHPHWHLDCELASALVINRFHFGMGGWECSQKSGECWQRTPGDFKALALWAKRTLEYSRDQLAQYPPVTPR